MMNPNPRHACTLFLALLLCASPGIAQQVMVNVTGAGPDGLPGTESNLGYPVSLFPTATGDVLIGISGRHRIYRLAPGGSLTIMAGHGGSCFNSPYGDGLPAKRACFNGPNGVVMDAAGNVYIADSEHHAIRRVDAVSGLISRHAGDYQAGFTLDDAPATSCRLNRPHGLAINAQGDLFIADRGNHRIRKLTAATGILTTVAGSGIAGSLGDGGSALQARINAPRGVALDGAGNILIADTGNFRVRRVDAATGIITTVAGNGQFGYIEDGVAATSTSLAGPVSVAADSAGNVYFGDSNDQVAVPIGDDTENHRVRRVDALTGIITTVAGSGTGDDGGLAMNAPLGHPSAVALDGAGNLLVADFKDYRIRRIDALSGVITTIAGNRNRFFSGDGSHARRAAHADFGALLIDPAGNLIIANNLWGEGRVRQVDRLTGIITTIAGNGAAHFSTGDGGPALMAGMPCPYGLARDQTGSLFISDVCDHRVRKVAAATGIITTVAGTGYGYGGDGGPATAAQLNTPVDLAVDATGNLYIADSENLRIRRVEAATGLITTIAGTGFSPGDIDGPGGDPRDDLGDGGPAESASLGYVTGLALSPAGGLALVDSSSQRVRLIDLSTGVITTIAGTGVFGYAGDGGPATSAALRNPSDVAYDPGGSFYITDNFNDRIRRVDAATGIITTVAGNGTRTYSVEGTVATSSSVYGPDSIVVGPAGEVYFALPRYNVVRTLSTPPPSGAEPGSLTVSSAPGGSLRLAWGASCVPTDNDYALYEGVLGDFMSHAPLACSTGGALSVTVSPGAGSTYYLLVPRNGVSEGSYGLTSSGAERPASTAACVPQQVTQVCN